MSEFRTGRIVGIDEEHQITTDQGVFYTQVVSVQLPGEATTLHVPVGSEYQPLTAQQRLNVGTTVIVSPQPQPDGLQQYVITDVYRLPIMGWLLAGFLLASVVVARWRGLLAIGGLVMSLVILFYVLIPQLLTGTSPILISSVAATAIAVTSIYLSHGFNRKSHLGLLSMILTMIAVIVLSDFAVHAAQLVGLGSEEAAFLQFAGTNKQLNLQGLLLAGIMLGTLGVLDDIVISQIAVVEQLLGANHKLSFDELYRRALAVGQDHVASLVNTLVLAYAGANLPLFLLFYLNHDTPLWVTLNNELIAEEVLRTLVGSLGLVLAVPLTTFIASWALRRTDPKQLKASAAAGGHQHHH